MKTRSVRIACLLFAAWVVGMSLPARGGQYFQEFNSLAFPRTTNFGDGSVLIANHLGTVSGASSGELRLTSRLTNGTQVAFMLPDLDPGSPVYAFSMRFNMVIDGAFPNAADGFSINFGQLRGLNLINPATAQESGYGVGLSVGVQTYGQNSPGFHVRANGAWLAYSAYNPQTQWGVDNLTPHYFEIDWHHVHGLSLRVDHNVIFNNVATPNFVPRSGDSFVIAARTGGLAQTMQLDNLLVFTKGNMARFNVGLPYYSTPGTLSYYAFDDNNSTEWYVLTGTNGYVGGTVSGGAQAVRAYTVTRYGAGSNARDPRTFSLEASDNAGGNWSALHSTTVSWTSRPETRCWFVSDTSPHAAYRLNITEKAQPWIDWGPEVAEVRLYDITPFVPIAPTLANVSVGTVHARTADVGVTANAGGLNATVTLEWGATASYGNSIPVNIGATANTNVWLTLSNLASLTTYHYRFVISSLAGTNVTADHTFTTGQWTPVALPGIPDHFRLGVSAWGDYNNDGRIDLFVIGEVWNNGLHALLWRNDGNGQFTQQSTPFPGMNQPAAAWGDYNNDGLVDLLIAGAMGASRSIELWRNDGSGSFTKVSLPGMPGVANGKLKWVDFNRDGKLDICVFGSSSAGEITQLWRGAGDGTFVHVPVPGLGGGSLGGIDWADFDNDGFFDLILTGSGKTELWRNLDGNNFQQVPLPGVPGLSKSAVAWGDSDNDGRPDFFLSGFLSGVTRVAQLWRNNGSNGFTLVPTPGIPGGDLAHVAWADVDNDGTQDIITAADLPNFVQVWRNQGSNGFSGIGLPTHYYPSVSVADYDKDGRVDLMTIGMYGNSRLWRNEAPVTNAPPSVPSGLAVTVNGNNATFTWNAASDATTPAAALSYSLRVGTGYALGQLVGWSFYGDGSPQVIGAGNVGTRRTVTYPLPPGTYHWGLQSVDNGLRGSGIANGGTFTVAGAAPVATTLPATNVMTFLATLAGAVSPVALPTTAWFEYGATASYGNRSIHSSVAPNTANTRLLQSLSLLPQTTVHYRLVVSNALGVSFGANQTFTSLGDVTIGDVLSTDSPITGTSANSPAGEEVFRAIDNTAATKYLNFDELNAGLVVQTTGARVVRALSLISAADSPERDPASFLLEGSLDGTNYSVIASNVIQPFVARSSIQTLALSNSTAFIYYRLRFPTVANASSANAVQIAEVELLAYPEISSSNDLVTATANGPFWSAPQTLADRHMNGNFKFAVENNTSNVVVDITPAAGSTLLKAFELIGGGDSGNMPERHPVSLTVLGSNDGTNFVTLGSFTPARPTSNLQIEEFSLASNNGAYTHYRFNFGPQQSGVWWQLAEVRLFGELAAALPPSLTVKVSGANLIVSWPDAPGFSLVTKSALEEANWSPVFVTPALSNGVKTVTLPMSGPTGFFRLVN